MGRQKEDPIGTLTVHFDVGAPRVIRNAYYSSYQAAQRALGDSSFHRTIDVYTADDAEVSFNNSGIRSVTWRPKRPKR